MKYLPLAMDRFHVKSSNSKIKSKEPGKFLFSSSIGGSKFISIYNLWRCMTQSCDLACRKIDTITILGVRSIRKSARVNVCWLRSDNKSTR